jgi:hypothetical protein
MMAGTRDVILERVAFGSVTDLWRECGVTQRDAANILQQAIF